MFYIDKNARENRIREIEQHYHAVDEVLRKEHKGPYAPRFNPLEVVRRFAVRNLVARNLVARNFAPDFHVKQSEDPCITGEFKRIGA